MPAVTEAEWNARAGGDARPEPGVTAVPLRTTVRGARCTAYYREGAAFALRVGRELYPSEMIADYREAVRRHSHMPREMLAAFDEFETRSALSALGPMTIVAPTPGAEGNE